MTRRPSRSWTPSVPLGRGRSLGLHLHTINDRLLEDKQVSRLPDRRWYLHARLHRGPTREVVGEALRGYRLGEPGWENRLKADVAASERDLGTIAKGWFRLGWTRYRFKTVEAEFAIGGEDNHVQVALRTPLASGAVGVKVPRAWTRGWVYHRREWAIKLGYIGSIAWVEFAHDSHMESTGMDDYYRRMRERGEAVGHVTDAMLWNGWAHYVGGTNLPGRARDRLLGKVERTEVTVEKRRIPIEMDDRVYWCQARLYDETRARKRGTPVTRRYVGMEFATEGADPPPQFAGKGENSWDCDDDGIYGCTYETGSFSEAARRYVAEVEGYRQRYGPPRETRVES